MKKMIVSFAAILGFMLCAQAQLPFNAASSKVDYNDKDKTTYYDSNGRRTGTSKVAYYDEDKTTYRKN